MKININKTRLGRELKKLVPKKFGKYHIYITDWKNSPTIIKLLGLTRKRTFNAIGSGVSSSIDLDFSDKNGFKQMIVLNPMEEKTEEKIVGQYRFLEDMELGNSAMLELFDISSKHVPWMKSLIELGRSMISPKYQKTRDALSSLFHGLGTVIAYSKRKNGLLGKVTISDKFNKNDQLLICAFFESYLQQKKDVLKPKKEFQVNIPKKYTMEFIDLSFKEGRKKLRKSLSTPLPPIISMYFKFADPKNIYYFGAVYHKEFNAIEAGIAIMYKDIHEDVWNEYISPYL